MNILILTQFYPPEIGATQTRMHHFATRLSQKGHNVTVISEIPNHPKGIIPPEYRGKLFAKTKEDTINVIRLWVYTTPNKTPKKRLLFYGTYMANSIIAAALLTRQRYDVVFATSPPLPAAVAGYVISKLKRCPFVLDIRDLWPSVAVEIGELKGNKMISVANRIEGFLYKRASAITCTTQRFVNHIVSKGATKSKVFHLPNGTVPEFFNPDLSDTTIRQRLAIQQDFVIGFCGNHGLAQSMENTMETAKLLRNHKDIKFLFVGEGPVKTAIQQYALSNKLDNVIFHPEVPINKISNYINSCNLMLVTLRKADLFSSFIPSKMFDYMACCKPIILTVDGEAREIMEEAGGGIYVEADDPLALSKAILQLKASPPEHLKEMGENGMAYVLSNYLRDTQSDHLESILTGVIDK